jgi:NADPH-dependent glutamate synthase beta subunit-like oxidoreductase
VLSTPSANAIPAADLRPSLPHPCEDYCRRGIEDEPVSINQLKRFVADYEMNSGTRLPIPCAPDTGKRVAIIGGGPAGVSCAYFLRRLGHHPTIYEAMSKLGGITRYGIPEYRLPDEVWTGSRRHSQPGHRRALQHRLGEDFTIQSLREEGYDAIFMGIGAWKDYTLGIKGEDAEGVSQGINFLSTVADSPRQRVYPSANGRRWSAAATRPSTVCAPCCASAAKRFTLSIDAPALRDAGQRSGNRGRRARRHQVSVPGRPHAGHR